MSLRPNANAKQTRSEDVLRLIRDRSLRSIREHECPRAVDEQSHDLMIGYVQTYAKEVLHEVTVITHAAGRSTVTLDDMTKAIASVNARRVYRCGREAAGLPETNLCAADA